MLNRNAKRVTIYSAKGGCGKSTLTANIARGYSILNQKTLIIDMDFQSDQLIHFKLKKDDFRGKSFDDFLLNDNTNLEDYIIKTDENLYLAATLDVAKLEDYLHLNKKNIKTFLKNKLQPELNRLDFKYVFLDLAPSRSKINDMCLYYIQNIILPVQMTVISTNSVVNTLEYLEQLNLSANNLIKAVIPNMYRKNIRESEECLNVIKNLYGDKVTVPVKFSTAISKVSNQGEVAIDVDENIKSILLDILKKVVPNIE